MTSSYGRNRPPAAQRLRALLGIPLFHKILGANAAILVVMASAIIAVTTEDAGAGGGADRILITGIGLSAVVVSLALNAVLIRLALEPLRGLERTAERVARGDFAARAPDSILADPATRRLTATFNTMLDRLEHYRRRVGELAGRALQASEEERARIARVLTDETAQSLAALQLRVRLARALPADMREIGLDLIAAQLTDAVEHVRATARELHAPPLDLLGLTEALEVELRAVERATGITIERELSADAGALSPAASLALYRIMQEALSNVSRHAEAARVTVRLARRNGGIEGVVEDDGRGFDPERVNGRDGRGLGLVGIRERAAYVGGTAEITSGPGRGTRVYAIVPMAEPSHD